MKKLVACDLFCGGGGTSTGLVEAFLEVFGNRVTEDVDLLAINHWPLAIATHSAAHPWARHLCMSIDHVRPTEVIKGGRIHILAASPECTHHSVARGGRPINDQSRAGAWQVLKFLQELYVDNVVLENVVEFEDWAPLGVNGKPLKSRKGETFRAFINAIRSLDYNVEYRRMNACDYGVPTSRTRLIIQARRNHPITWPKPTHGTSDLFSDLQPYRVARDIIDWDIPTPSIFRREKPLAPSTMRRIMAGFERFNHELKPYIVTLRNHVAPRSIDEPLPTITAGGTHLALAVPFLVKYNGTGLANSIDEPLDTVTTRDRFGLVVPEIKNGRVDIGFRMIQWKELAAAQGFPAGYQFQGTKKEIVKQVGNAVPVGLARALFRNILKDYPGTRRPRNRREPATMPPSEQLAAVA